MTPPTQATPPAPLAAPTPALLSYVHQLLATTAAAWGLATQPVDERQLAAA